MKQLNKKTKKDKTMIITTVTQNDFHDAFSLSRPDNFSYDGLNALYEYFDDYSEDTGEPFELDVIAICCEFTEYDNFTEINKAYPDIKSMEALEDYTCIIETHNSIIIQDF